MKTINPHTNNPAVSIIMPVFNAAEFLPDSIGSIINQTFTDFELICFNDASTDDSLSVLNEFSVNDNRIQVIDSKQNIKQGG